MGSRRASETGGVLVGLSVGLVSMVVAPASCARPANVFPTAGVPEQAEPKLGPTPAVRMAALPVRFEVNRGQFDDKVSFGARGPGYSLLLTPEGATLALQRKKRTTNATEPATSNARAARRSIPQANPDRVAEMESAAITMRVVGGRAVRPSASEKLPGSSNYFVGADRSKWREGIEGYARLLYRGVRPGLDVVFYSDGQRALEYDLMLAPEADASQLALAFDGADAVEIDRQGDLILRAGGGEIRQPPPVAYQRRADGERVLVTARYEKRHDGTVGFAVGPRDAHRGLVIDPSVVFSTYLGGLSADSGMSIAVDPAGFVYVTGMTSSTDFPTVLSAQPTNMGHGDAFVTKLSPTGTVVYSTYLGGATGTDFGNGVAADSAGFAYVTGQTLSVDFPVVAAFQSTARSIGDAFVAKLSATGAIIYSTYLGGSSNDGANGIAVDAAGSVYITGFTASTDFPTVSPFQPTNHGGPDADNLDNIPSNGDAFVSKLNSAGVLIYSTYLGGSHAEIGYGIAVDGAGSAYVTGATASSDFPTASPFQAATHRTCPANTDGGSSCYSNVFITKLNPSGSSLVYSTYLGGSTGADHGNDIGNAIVIDNAGSAYVTGATGSSDFPTVSAFQPTKHPSQNSTAFVTKINANGSSLVYSTYLGGSGVCDEPAHGIAVDGVGEAYVTGDTCSTDFPVVSANQPSYGGNQDAFITKLNRTGSALVYSTYWGGSLLDSGSAIAVDGTGVAYVAGYTNSRDFPVAPAFQGTNAGLTDVFVTKLSPLPPTAVPSGTPLTAAVLALLLVTVSTKRLLRRDRAP